MRVLVLGGYGNFGARICRALASDLHISLLIGGRDVQQAAALAAQLPGAEALRVDSRQADLADLLRAQRGALLSHTAGPFQGLDSTAARAAAAAGAHYIDLAARRLAAVLFCRPVLASGALFAAAHGRHGARSA